MRTSLAKRAMLSFLVPDLGAHGKMRLPLSEAQPHRVGQGLLYLQFDLQSIYPTGIGRSLVLMIVADLDVFEHAQCIFCQDRCRAIE